MTTRLAEIACSLQRGDALAGAMSALDGWEARNIGAARMRGHLKEAHRLLLGVATDIQHVVDDLAYELERRPVRLSWWARIFGGKSV